MFKKILLIIGTHGDEKIGEEIVKNLESSGWACYFDYLLANPGAYKQDKRFLQADLNRVYPGRASSAIYEKRLAAQNLKIVRGYDYVLDIHEAREGGDSFIIVPKKSLPQNFPLASIELDKLIYWPEPPGAISSLLENGVELEFGVKDKNREEVVRRATKVVRGFLEKVNSEKDYFLVIQKKYYVYGVLKAGEADIKDLKDFQKFSLEKECFYPLLVGQYESEGILCYKMKKI